MSKTNLQAALADLTLFAEEKQLKVTMDKDLEKTLADLLGIYREVVLENGSSWRGEGAFGGTDYYPAALIKEVKKRVRCIKLTPHIISEFISTLAAANVISEENDFNYWQNYSESTGPFISGLIVRAYARGHTKFDLQMGLLKHIYNFMPAVSGTEKKPLDVTIRGELGGGFCDSKYVRATLHGDFGVHGGYCIYGTKHSVFTFYGKVGTQTGRHGAPQNCVFKSPDRDVLVQIQKSGGNGNKYYLLKDGKEVLFK